MNVNKEQTAARQCGTAPHSTEPATVNTVTVGEKHKPRKETEIEKKGKIHSQCEGRRKRRRSVRSLLPWWCSYPCTISFRLSVRFAANLRNNLRRRSDPVRVHRPPSRGHWTGVCVGPLFWHGFATLPLRALRAEGPPHTVESERRRALERTSTTTTTTIREEVGLPRVPQPYATDQCGQSPSGKCLLAALRSAPDWWSV